MAKRKKNIYSLILCINYRTQYIKKLNVHSERFKFQKSLLNCTIQYLRETVVRNLFFLYCLHDTMSYLFEQGKLISHLLQTKFFVSNLE